MMTESFLDEIGRERFSQAAGLEIRIPISPVFIC